MAFEYLGESAALVTAVVWAASSQFHGTATKYLGVGGVTLLRIPYNLLLLTALFALLRPANVFDSEIAVYLVLSAFFGVALCDTSFYKAVHMIGPRLGCLVQSLSACTTALLGYLMLGESIGLVGSLGIGVAIFGVFFVLAEGGGITLTHRGETESRELFQGAALAFFSAVMLSLSMIFLKEALLRGSTPLFASIVRLIAGGAMLLAFYGYRGWLKKIWVTAKNTPASWKYMLIGGIFGTTGIWSSAVAMGNTAAGVAATIISLEPVMIIPINAFYEGKKPSMRAIFGTIIAFCGVAILIMR